MTHRICRRASIAVAAMLAAAAVPAAAQVEPPTLWGIYTHNSYFIPAALQEIQGINTWIGDPARHMSLLGTFVDLEDPSPSYNVPTHLNVMWNAGGVPFINLSVGSGRTALLVAQGGLDPQIVAIADVYKAWAASGGGKRAFIAIFPEMNGWWVPYGQDPVNFKLAYTRIQSIFTQRGVPRATVRWVFAPNGHGIGGNAFENYYPGNAAVDILAFSAYNFGTCSPWPSWDTFDAAFRPYLDRMRFMAPSKPIFLAQTATVASGGDKNVWLDDSFTRLAAYPALRGVLYFHYFKNEGLPCDPVEWRFYAPPTVVYPGIRTGLLRPASGFGHWAPTAPEWANIAFAPGPGGNTFQDVEPAHPFAGVPNIYYYDSVQRIAASGVSGGCSTSPPLYCPEATVTRGQMAVYLLRAQNGPTYTPPACTTPRFADVPCSNPFATWVNELAARGITSGCGGGSYCPTAPVSRDQMAVFLLKTRLGSTYTPPACTNPTFSDVPCSNPYAAWIYDLVARGITAGCGTGSYCPTATVGRGQMAVFVVSMFGL